MEIKKAGNVHYIVCCEVGFSLKYMYGKLFCVCLGCKLERKVPDRQMPEDFVMPPKEKFEIEVHIESIERGKP